MASAIDQAEAIRIAETLTGQPPDRVSDLPWPAGLGGAGAVSVRLHYGEATRLLTRRPDAARAKTELRLTQALGGTGAPVPEVVTINDVWAIEEDLGDQRLTHVLNGADPVARATATESAVVALSECHDAARKLEPIKSAEMLGFRRDWIQRLIQNPGRISLQAGIVAPALDADRLVPLLRVRTASVVKWGARPSACGLRDNGTLLWMDWSTAGRRNPVDDLVWFLGDELMPEDPATEADVLQRHVRRFNMGFDSVEETLLYFLAYGVFHIAVRIDLILRERSRTGRWLDLADCVDTGGIGVSPVCVDRLCRRGSRWALANPLTAPMSGWFREIAEHAQGLDRQTSAAA